VCRRTAAGTLALLLALLVASTGCDEDELPPPSATVPAYAPTNWVQCRSAPGDPNSIRYGGGVWVAFNKGYGDTRLAMSTDLTTWSTVQGPGYLMDLEYGGGCWVGVGPSLNGIGVSPEWRLVNAQNFLSETLASAGIWEGSEDVLAAE